MSSLLDHPAALTNQLRRVAIEAGEVTLDFFEEAGLTYEAKDDGSPVSLADQKAEERITGALKDLTPDIPLIGEESVASGKLSDLSSFEYFWLVDPLDGTKEFISGSGEYTVNIALIEGGKPVIGVVYAPATGELYAAHGPDTAIKWLAETGNEKLIRVRPPPPSGLNVVASKSHGSGEKLDHYLAHFKINKLIKRGSSLKICSIAAGKADLYPRFGPTCEWDTAAAHAVLSSAGGILVDAKSGTSLTYGHNRQGKWLNPEFIASGFELGIISESA
jgi:3'(2'), 5'-bisphosphate nucleotidase